MALLFATQVVHPFYRKHCCMLKGGSMDISCLQKYIPIVMVDCFLLLLSLLTQTAGSGIQFFGLFLGSFVPIDGYTVGKRKRSASRVHLTQVHVEL